MATGKDVAAKVLEKLQPLDVQARPMFGEFGLFYKGKMFGLLSDNVLFVKVTDAGAALAGRIAKVPPYPGATPAYKISSAKINDRAWLTELVEITTEALPTPRKKNR